MRHVGSKLLYSRLGRLFLSVMLGVLSVGAGFYGFKAAHKPGPVSAANPRGLTLGGYTSHAEFEKECKHCHAPIHCITATRCQKCHIDVARQRAEATGLHGLLPGTNKCQNCHVEHQGREAVISHVPFENIDHERLTGFSLATHQTGQDGKPAACYDCHLEHRFSAEGVDCIGCHTQNDADAITEHIQRYGERCFECHDGRDRMFDFDHDPFFPLQDGHADAPCEDCHTQQTYVGIPSACSDCHETPDTHADRFGLDCSRCHNAVAFAPAQLTRHIFHLDHSDQGMIACETCHTASYAEHTCYGCHDHTPEGMAAAHVREGITEFENCVECHPTGQPGEGKLALYNP